MLEIKHNVTEMKNAFYGLTSRLDTALERILKTEDISIVTPQNLKSKENRDWKKEENIQGLWVTTNGVTHMEWGHRKEKEERKEHKIYLK